MNLNLTPCVCLGILQSPYIFENKICAASEGLHKVPNFTRWSAAALGFEPRVIWLSYKKGRKKRKYSEMTQELLSPACRWVVRFWDMAIKFRYSQGTDSVVSIEWKQEGWWGWWVIWTGFQRKNLCHHVCHNTTGLEEVWSCPIQPLVFTGEETKVSRGAVLLLSWGHVMWRLMVPQRPFNRTTLWGVYMPFHFCSDKNPVREAGQTCLLLVGSEGVRETLNKDPRLFRPRSRVCTWTQSVSIHSLKTFEQNPAYGGVEVRGGEDLLKNILPKLDRRWIGQVPPDPPCWRLVFHLSKSRQDCGMSSQLFMSSSNFF